MSPVNGPVFMYPHSNVILNPSTFDICVIASVEKGKRDSGKRLDKLEAHFQHRLMCMDALGGLNIRCEARRGGGKQGN